MYGKTLISQREEANIPIALVYGEEWTNNNGSVEVVSHDISHQSLNECNSHVYPWQSEFNKCVGLLELSKLWINPLSLYYLLFSIGIEEHGDIYFT
jgi:hypothetical protein